VKLSKKQIQQIRNTKFLPYQNKIIADKSRYILCEKSRRVGISFAIAYKALLWAIETPQKVYYVSNNFQRSLEFGDYVRKFGELINLEVGSDVIDLKKSTQKEIKLTNGGAVVLCSSDPDSLRGCTGSVILDEFAFSEQPQDLLAAARPVVSGMGYAGNLCIISSHRGQTFFYDMVQNAKRNQGEPGSYSVHSISIHDALADGFAVKTPGDHQQYLPDLEKTNEAFLSELKRSLAVSETIFKQEYELEPVAAGSTVISKDLYNELAIVEGTDTPLDFDRSYNDLYIGVDFGKSDQTVVWVVEERYNPLVDDEHLRREFFTRHVAVLSGKNASLNLSLPEQTRFIRRWINHPNVFVCYMDQGSFGLSIYEDLKQTTGKVKGYTFSNPNKADLAETMRAYAEHRRIAFPSGRNDIREDVTCVQAVTNKFRSMSYDGRSVNGHGDCFWSCALALKAAEEVRNFGCIAVGF